MENRLTSSHSMPTLPLPRSGASSRAPSSSGRPSQAHGLIPACYASHKAMARTFRASPGLFAGGGARVLGSQPKFVPVDSRGKGVMSIAYQRRQLQHAEAEAAGRGLPAAPEDWRAAGPQASGAALYTIHRDLR
mmetsp:Transcript_74742/g.211451  ORF Transcript_74742/g.211451 Transcript_74742/m.211451 type:complete len:134 (+) Transcript_74742:81-482(+)